MIRREQKRMVVSGPVTLANVAEVLAEGRRHLREGVRVVDLGEVTELDSSLVAVLLVWVRDARRASFDLSVAQMPEGLATIARLYGVEALLPTADTGG